MTFWSDLFSSGSRSKKRKPTRKKTSKKARVSKKASPKWVVYDSDYIGDNWHKNAFVGVSKASTELRAIKEVGSHIEGAAAMSVRKWLSEGGSL